MKEPNRERKNPIKAINKIQLDEGQKEAKAGVYDKDISIFLGNFGSGKAQPYYSKILTPSGWTTMGDIKVGDIVCTPSTPAKVLQIFEQGYKDIYRVYFDDGNFADCCEDHLWKVSTSDSRSHWKYKGSGQNKKALFKYPVKYQVLPLKIIKEDLIKNGHNHYNYAIPVSPVELEEKNYYIDPYILGCLLGDGSTRSTLSITTMDDFIYREFVCKLTPLGFILKKTTNSTGSLAETYRIVDTKGYTKKTSSATGINKINTIKEELRRLNLDDKLSYDKHIPIEYLQGSIKQRIALLQGLMDTDGSINKNSLTFSSSSLSLFKDIKYLIESLGGVVKIGKPKYFKNSSYKTHYRMTFKIGDINPFRLPRKKDLVKPNQYSQQRFITKVEYLHKEKAKCILIDNADHLYYTDNFIITHNTLTAVVTALDLLLKKQIDKIFITRPIDFEATGFLKGTASEKMAFHIYPIKQNMYDSYDKQKVDSLFEDGSIQIVPIDYMKGYTFTNSCTIVDEFEDISYEEFKLILTRLGVGSKLIFTGSEEQIGIKNSCMPKIKKLAQCESVNFHILKGQHRNENVQKVLDFLDNIPQKESDIL